ncbi:MAG: VIT1/CCC1 transporter family protein [Sciscionella sp.]
MASDTPAEEFPTHLDEPHTGGGVAQRMNWLRAGVLGANDGIVSVAAIVVGVAGVTGDRGTIVTAGVAGLVGGAISMALGEYVSVSSQRDSERALIAKERQELADDPVAELAELATIYQERGLSAETAQLVATELTQHDALGAHLEAELHIDRTDVPSPWHAALASAVSFTIGAVLPLLAISLPPQEWRVVTTVVAVLLALSLTGWSGAVIGGGPRVRASLRVIVGGGIALGLTFLLGHLIGASGVA